MLNVLFFVDGPDHMCVTFLFDCEAFQDTDLLTLMSGLRQGGEQSLQKITCWKITGIEL